MQPAMQPTEKPIESTAPADGASVRFVLAATFLLLLTTLLGAPARAEDATDSSAEIEGLWLTEEGDGIVRIAPCREDAAALCGRLVWVDEPLDESNRLERDDENPDAELRRRPVLGLQILQGFPGTPDDGVYEGGTIYDPNNGKTYSAKLTPDGPDTLKIRGFVGVSLLGRTTVWRRVAGPDALEEF